MLSTIDHHHPRSPHEHPFVTLSFSLSLFPSFVALVLVLRRLFRLRLRPIFHHPFFSSIMPRPPFPQFRLLLFFCWIGSRQNCCSIIACVSLTFDPQNETRELGKSRSVFWWQGMRPSSDISFQRRSADWEPCGY